MKVEVPMPKFNNLKGGYFCPRCGRQFQTHSGYFHHWRNKHTSVNSTENSE